MESPDSQPWAPPREFGEYVVQRLLGGGAMGQVYLAQDTVLARPVAIKFIATERPSHDARERFLVEARAAARLTHSNVAGVHRVGTIDGRPYLVSEFVEGQALSDVDLPLPEEDALRIALGISRGLAEAHRHGVLHRDIKPANVLLTEDGTAKLVDFGLAKLLEADHRPGLDAATSKTPSPRLAARPQDSRAAPTAMSPAAGGPPAVAPRAAAATLVRAPEPTPPGPAAPPRAAAATLVRAPEPTDPGPAAAPRAAAATLVRAPEPTPPGPAAPPRAAAATLVRAPEPTDPGPAAAPRAAAATLVRPPRTETPPRPKRATATLPPVDRGGPDVTTRSPAPRTRDLTQAGSVMGTPDYMSPESWRGEAAAPQTDIYSVGALVYELLTGAPPFAFVPEDDLKAVVLSQRPPGLGDTAPHVNPQLARLVDRCLAMDPEDRPGSAAELRDELENLSYRPRVEAPTGNPFRGLEPFEAQHRGVFFGRETETEEILQRLGRQAFILVTGDSGTGKSSICRASVIPRSTHSGLTDGRSWAAVTVSPGPKPLTHIAASLASFARLEPDEYIELAGRDPRAAALALQRALGGDRGLICFVDQLEELVTHGDGVESLRAEAFVAELASGFPGVKLLATVRADFLTRVASLEFLGPHVPRGIFLLRPVAGDRIRQVIVEPVHAAGLRFESDALIDELVDWAEGSPSSLPILQFALSKLWEVRDEEQGLLTAEGLDKIGGVGGALAQHADRVISGLVGNHRALARNLLMRLVGGDGVRVNRTIEELVGPDKARVEVLDRLVEGRLIALGESDEGATCSLIHDVLLREWATLAQWVNEATETNLVHERLRTAAMEWHRLEQSSQALWSSQLLREARGLERGRLSELEATFLQRSIRAQRWRIARRAGFALALPACLGGFYAEGQMRARARIEAQLDQAAIEAEAALERAQEAESEALTARRAATARLVDRDREGGESAWRDVTRLERQIGQFLQRANQSLEAAVALAPDREDLRGRFGDLLLTRARHAHRNRAFDQRDELLSRLGLYDADGSRLAQWSAPGTVDFRGLPPGAEVAIERYRRGPSRLELEPVAGSGAARELAPGSYRATIAAGGRRWFHPFVLNPAQRVIVDIEIPAPEAPDGFEYIPPGRFQFGSTAEEEARLGFFDAPPLHPVESPAYFIARHEVTFGEWIEWLEVLAPEEAQRHLPGMVDDAGLTTGGLRLYRDDEDRWALEFQPGTETYRATVGEPIQYPDRDDRAEQDWLRFPVVAVTARDAEAFARWLDASGRVPGARLCTEHEWERAARGADDREYPHGSRLAPDDINFDQTYGKRSGGIGLDEVGSHPASTSPFGIDDLAGNAFEWTTSSLSPGQYVLRGGSYFYDAATNRSTNRSEAVPTLRVASVGVRLCASPRP